jgi:hypothetical protein
MWWLNDLVIPVILIIGLGCFVITVLWRTRLMTRKTTRSAEDLYPRYADSIQEQRKYAREHGGQWHDDEGRHDAMARHLAPPSKTAARHDGNRP